MIKLRPLYLIKRAVRYVVKGPLPDTEDVQIGYHTVGRKHPCFFVAEIGINHNGSLEVAKKLIDVAADAGAQAVKFQKRTVPTVYSAEELAKLSDIYNVDMNWLLGKKIDAVSEKVQLAARYLMKLKKNDLDHILDLLKTMKRA